MKPERWRKIKEVCQEAAARDAAGRAAYLDEACAGDADLRREVEALLATESEAEGFLTSPAWRLPVIEPGTRLGPYEILALMGAGGMGEVYKARDTRLDRTVALKILPPEVQTDPDRRARFAREAKTISQLSHPNICVLHDVGEAELASAQRPAASAYNLQYLVMEHLEGQTLAERLRKSPLLRAQALELGAQIADALAAAHKQGVVHRDLKPANVMLVRNTGSSEATVKLLDFGLAKLKAGSGLSALGSGVAARPGTTASEPLTARGVILGTLAYMAPEQLEGKPADARTDLWALGTILYEMLIGRPAFEGDSSASLIGAILVREPEPLAVRQPLTPPALERLVRKCLAKAPEDRWDTAHDVADELRWIAQTRTTAGVEAPPVRPGVLRTWLVAAVVLAAGLIGAGAMWLLRGHAPRPLPTRVSLDVRPADELNAGGYPSAFIPTPGGSRTALAWTPDGRALVFVGRRDGVQRLYVRPLDAAQASALAGTEGAQVPAVSPDGRWVAFWAGEILKKVPLGGGPVMDLVSGLEYPPIGLAWGPRGRLFFAMPGGPISEVSADGVTRAVTTTERTEMGQVFPSVLPGGGVVLYTVLRRLRTWGGEEIVAETLATGERKLLLRDAVDARYLPTGHLVFLRRGVLFGVPFDVRRLEVRGTPVAVLGPVAQALTSGNTVNVTGAGQFAVSGTGTLAWVRGPSVPTFLEGRLVAVDRRGQVSRLSAPVRSYSAGVRVSPDGRRLVVVIQSLTEMGLWVYDFGREVLTPLLREGEAAWPLWSRDGQRVLFSWFVDGRASLADLAADGSRPATRLPALVPHPSSVTPDGRHIAGVDCPPRGGCDLTFVKLEEGQDSVRALQRTPQIERWPEFSPDGRWLAYGSNLSGRFEVYIQPYPGPGAAVQASAEGGESPAWHPGGRELFFVSPRDAAGKRRMMVVDVEPGSVARVGRPHELFEFDADDLRFACLPLRCYDVAPDGQRFYVLRTPALPPPPVVTQIELLQNWFEELKAKVGG